MIIKKSNDIETIIIIMKMMVRLVELPNEPNWFHHYRSPQKENSMIHLVQKLAPRLAATITKNFED